METQSRNLFYQDDDFILEWEEWENKLLVHCNVSTWKPSVLKRGYSKFCEILQYSRDCGYEYMFTVSPNPKFARLFGGDAIGTVWYYNKEYEVIVWH